MFSTVTATFQHTWQSLCLLILKMFPLFLLVCLSYFLFPCALLALVCARQTTLITRKDKGTREAVAGLLRPGAAGPLVELRVEISL